MWPHAHRRARLRLETLESKAVPTTVFTVTNADDAGDNSLRWAITKANLTAVNVLVQSADDVHLQGAAAALAAQRGESGKDVPYRFDLVVSHLTLHHIPSMGRLLATLKDCLRSGGMLALTDYEDFGPDAIEFHAESKRSGVERHGIKKGENEDIIDGVGFNEVVVASLKFS